jgi:excisionase family DNA binding protein
MNGGNENKLAGWRERLLLDYKEVALLLDVSLRTVYRLVDMGELQSVKVRGSVRLMVSDVVAYLERLKGSNNRQAEVSV